MAPNHSGNNNCSLKFELPKELRERFIAQIERLGPPLSQALMLRMLLEEWTLTMEDEEKA